MQQQFRQMETQFVVGGSVERRSRFVFTFRAERVAELLLCTFTC